MHAVSKWSKRDRHKRPGLVERASCQPHLSGTWRLSGPPPTQRAAQRHRNHLQTSAIWMLVRPKAHKERHAQPEYVAPCVGSGENSSKLHK